MAPNKEEYLSLTLLHSERPKLHTILAFLRAIGLKTNILVYWVPCSYYSTSQCNWYFYKGNSQSHIDTTYQGNYTAVNAWCVLCGREKKMSLSFVLIGKILTE